MAVSNPQYHLCTVAADRSILFFELGAILASVAQMKEGVSGFLGPGLKLTAISLIIAGSTKEQCR
jgi:hypothetical protein